MSARNIYHDVVLDALAADGWTVTDDPLHIKYVRRDLYIDLAAEMSPVGAERGGQRIAVEVQSFAAMSDVRNLEVALGQYVLYRYVLDQTDPGLPLFLAVPRRVYDGILSEPLGQLVVEKVPLRVMAFDHLTRRIVAWINGPDTGTSSGT